MANSVAPFQELTGINFNQGSDFIVSVSGGTANFTYKDANLLTDYPGWSGQYVIQGQDSGATFDFTSVPYVPAVDRSDPANPYYPPPFPDATYWFWQNYVVSNDSSNSVWNLSYKSTNPWINGEAVTVVGL